MRIKGALELRSMPRLEKSMNILVTAGNTQTPIDQVRCITNIFSGRTGARIAASAFDRGHTVGLLTSHPEVFAEFPSKRRHGQLDFRLRTYRTFNHLEAAMRDEITRGDLNVVIHAAAVSDYFVAGVYTQHAGRLEDVS